MTRQDVNQALLQTSFLYGANSAYIEALQAQYEKDPMSVEPGWRDFFAALGDDPASVDKTATGASWKKPNWPQTPKGDLINALDGDWPATEKALGDKIRAKAAEAAPGRAGERRRDPARHPRLGARDHDDPRLPHARPSARQPRSARPRAAEGPRGAASGDLRLHRGRLRPQDLHRPRARPRIRDRARDAGDPAPHLLRHDRLRVPAHLRSRPRRPGSRSASRGRTRRSTSPAKASAPSCRSWSRPKASRTSSTSSTPAPSASASTAARR